MSRLFDPKKIINYFAFEGHTKVEGWLSSHSLSFLYYLSQCQDELEIKGDIAEIGVFQGRFFIALCLLMRQEEKAVAIDVFDEQQYNIDKSGVGDFDIFCKNIEEILGDFKNINIIKSDSIKVTSAQLLKTTDGNKIRLFSIDGCHTAEHTESDLLLAAQSIVPGGIIILDDFENPAWPGVQQGANNFLNRTETVQPFALAYNKLYFTTADYIPGYSKYVEKIIMSSTDHISFEKISQFDVLKVLMPPVENLFRDVFQQYIDFSSQCSPEKYLTTGWSNPEQWGVWSQENSAELNVEVDSWNDAFLMTISFHAFVVEKHPEVVIDIHVNGRYTDSVIFKLGQDYRNWSTLLSAAEINNKQLVNILFNINYPISPFELGLSLDKRKLGIGLRNIRFKKT